MRPTSPEFEHFPPGINNLRHAVFTGVITEPYIKYLSLESDSTRRPGLPQHFNSAVYLLPAYVRPIVRFLTVDVIFYTDVVLHK